MFASLAESLNSTIFFLSLVDGNRKHSIKLAVPEFKRNWIEPRSGDLLLSRPSDLGATSRFLAFKSQILTRILGRAMTYHLLQVIIVSYAVESTCNRSFWPGMFYTDGCRRIRFS